jgi:hypothetical protein
MPHRVPISALVAFLLLAAAGPSTLTASAAAASPPAPVTLDSEEDAQLQEGEIVIHDDLPPGREKGVRVRAVVDVKASEDVLWKAVLDLPARVPENRGIKKVELYDEADNGAELRRGARWELEILGETIVFFMRYTWDKGASWLEWSLDPEKASDLVYSWGSCQVYAAPGKPGATRLVYTNETDSGRKLPTWFRRHLATSSLKDLIGGIRDRAERR